MLAQLCWSCDRAGGAVANRCCWEARFEPVEGWEAKPTIISGDSYPVESYAITKCPLYVGSGEITLKTNAKKWTDEDINKLTKYFKQGYDDGRIAKILDRPVMGVTHKRNKLGLH